MIDRNKTKELSGPVYDVVKTLTNEESVVHLIKLLSNLDLGIGTLKTILGCISDNMNVYDYPELVEKVKELKSIPELGLMCRIVLEEPIYYDKDWNITDEEEKAVFRPL